MDEKLLERIRNQTIRIYAQTMQPLGTGFFANDRIVITAEHCILQKSSNECMKEVLLYQKEDKFVKGIVLTCSKGIAIICASQPSHQEDRLPLGFCENLNRGINLDIYGYPGKAPEGYPNSIKISQKFFRTEEAGPTIQCLVRNIPGALNRYEGLSGSPAVIEDHIVGMVAKEDEGGDEVNAIHIIDFANFHDVFEHEGLALEKVYVQTQNKIGPSREALYGRAWWITNKTPELDEVMISDQYSIILATLLLGIEGKADIVLASPWEHGLAECLREETLSYKKEFSNWMGRQWVEYKKGGYPDWGKMENGLGVIVSIRAEDCKRVLLLGLLSGRRSVQKDILVVWNIWSESPEQAVFRAVRVAEQFEPDERKDVLTVFSLWKNEWENELCNHTFLVYETAKAWVESQAWRKIDWEAFLLSRDAEETDVLAGIFFQYCQGRDIDGARDKLAKLWRVCSDSIHILSSLCVNEAELTDLRKVELSAFKRWFARIKEKDCARILTALKEEEGQSLYWNAIISNPYCTRYVLQECGRNVLVRLILNPNINDCFDQLLYEEAENIRHQIRPG